MVTFGEITTKNLRVNYEKVEGGYKVVGSAGYNKEMRMTEASGNIRNEMDEHIASFNVYGEGEYARINLVDCIPAMMADAMRIAQAAIADLASTYPQE